MMYVMYVQDSMSQDLNGGPEGTSNPAAVSKTHGAGNLLS
jgi:hypothetical protein